MPKKPAPKPRPDTYFERVPLVIVPKPEKHEQPNLEKRQRPNLIVEPPSVKTEPYSVRPDALHGPERHAT